MIDEKLFERIENYLEEHCRDGDWLAKKVNPNWTADEYYTFRTLENYENYIDHLKTRGMTAEEIEREVQNFMSYMKKMSYWSDWEEYEKLLTNLREQNLSDEEFEESFEEYIKHNRPKFSIGGDRDWFDSITLSEKIIRLLKDKIGLAGSFFSDYLFKLIKQKKLSEVEVYKKAHLDRRIFSKIRKENGYMPSKQTIFAIIIAMELNMEEAEKLLEHAGYYFTDGRREDLIIHYFIENEIYDFFVINEVLEYYDCPTLGS